MGCVCSSCPFEASDVADGRARVDRRVRARRPCRALVRLAAVRVFSCRRVKFARGRREPPFSGGLGIYSCVKDACLQGADDDWVKICNDKSCYSNCTFDDDEWYEVCAMIIYACDNDDWSRCEAYSYSYNVDDYTWGGGAER